MPEVDGVHVGVDLGTSGLKAVAVSDSGEVVAATSHPYETQRPVALASEQNPHDWLRATGAALADLAAVVPASSWHGVGLTGMIPTLVLTDDVGVPVCPAVTWEDARASQQADRWLAAVGDRYATTGQRVDARYLLPMFLRLADESPQAAQHAAWLLGAKDYLYWWLTGVCATDPSTATGVGCFSLEAQTWQQDAWDRTAQLLSSPLPALPQVLPSTTVRPLTAERATELGLPAGLPIVLGAADSVCGATAFGIAHQPGAAMYLAGTSTVILAAADRPALDAAGRYLVTPLATPGSWGLEMDQLATGSALRWLGGLLGRDPDAVVAAAASADASRAPVVLPYLAPGEQGALWDENLRGAMVGLDLRHTADDLSRGLLTGIVLESRRCLEVITEVTGRRGELHLGGGGASPELAHELADATGRTVVLHPDSDPSALGAAMVARAATGLSAEQRETNTKPTIEPRTERAPLWAELERRHEEARHRLSNA